MPPSRVREGSPTSCGAGTAAGVLCFDVGNADGVDAVRIPNGAGGFVVVPIVAAPVVAVDSGTSTSAASNVDLRVGVDVRTGDVVRVERRTDSRRQLALATIGILLLAVIAAASVSTWIRVRRLEGR
ncbi:MAG TPA: hypothetical protein VFJ85_13485 [Acidimicrobiales bacterium]|nr:hypothetical protein [Acidimicrobiales bacterium]